MAGSLAQPEQVTGEGGRRFCVERPLSLPGCSEDTYPAGARFVLPISIWNSFAASALAARRSHPPDAANCESKGGPGINSCWAALPFHGTLMVEPTIKRIEQMQRRLKRTRAVVERIIKTQKERIEQNRRVLDWESD